MTDVRKTLSRGLLGAGLAVALTAIPQAGEAGNIKAGRDKAQKCEVCHGLDGIGKIAEAPNLAGQNEEYLIKQIEAFKTGQRNNEQMTLVVPALTQADIEDLAAYYAAIEVTIGKIPGE
jgi:cytochrome c553